MTEGKKVSVIADGDVVIERIVVSVENDVYFVCKREEFEQAKLEDRDPICIGFRREYVVSA